MNAATRLFARPMLFARLLATLLSALGSIASAQTGLITAVSAPRQVVNVGQNLTLTVTAPTATSFQWRRNGLPIPGATSATYTINSATPWRDNGWYQALASNSTASANSAVVFVNVKVPAVAFGWGSGTYGEDDVPNGAGEITGIAAGGTFNFLLRADGSLLGFGNGGYNQTTPPADLSSVVAVTIGQGQYGHAIALKADGTLAGWGYYDGLAQFPNSATSVVALAAGSVHSLALRSDGTVLGWGLNPSRQVSIPVGLDNIVALAAGWGHSLMLRSDGIVVGLGSNDAGQLSVPRDLVGVKAIAAGARTSLALKNDGTVVAWGDNSSGQTSIPRGLADVVAIAVGNAHCLALKSDGTVAAWGANNFGQSSVPAGLARVIAIAASGDHNLVLHDARGDSKPIIVAQPGNTQVAVGNNVTLNVTSNGSGTILGYQWRKDGVVILGATASAYTISEALVSDAGRYDVVVSNYLGSVTSSAATLTVSAPTPPAITAQPVSQSTVAGSTATFSVTASGTEPLAYQWRKDGAVINGATNATLTLNSVQSDQLGSYSVVVTNSLGSATSVSAVLSLTTNATYTFSTFAGSGTGGTVDGTGRAAQFNAPWGIAVDAAGNVYVSEGGASGVPAAPSHVIRKITPTGVVTTLAGRAGVGGSQDGAGTTATFSFPRGLTVDSGGTLYVAANGVRRISPAGVVSTLVASMNLPSALIFDLSGNLLVAESNVHAIKRVTPQGDVSNYAGTGSPGSLDGAVASAQFDGPSGIAADAFGNVYVSEYYNSTIRRINSAGSVSTFAGRARASGVADGVGADARFGGPLGLAVDIADALYVADYQNNLIRRISPEGNVVTIGGQVGVTGSSDGAGSAARFNLPAGVAVDRSGNVYVADTLNNVIRKGVPSAIPTPRRPAIISGPASVTISANQRATLSVAAAGFEVAYQWYSGNSGSTSAPIAGATSARFTTPDLTRTSNYWVRVSTAGGSVDAQTATVTVSEPAPVISTSVVQSTIAGQSATLSVAATGAGLSYQWYRGSSGTTSIPIAGATSASFATPFVTEATNYWVRITNPGGSVDSATLIAPAPSTSPSTPANPVPANAMGLVNMSIRVLNSGSPIIPGIVIDTPLKALIRVAGPSLAQFGVQGALANPKVTVYAAGRPIGENDDWGSNEAAVTAASAKTGAFPLIRGSKDAALIVDLPIGAYTCVVTGDPGSTGEVLLEVYRVP